MDTTHTYIHHTIRDTYIHAPPTGGTVTSTWAQLSFCSHTGTDTHGYHTYIHTSYHKRHIHTCPSYWWNSDKYLGPAVLLQSYRYRYSWIPPIHTYMHTIRDTYIHAPPTGGTVTSTWAQLSFCSHTGTDTHGYHPYIHTSYHKRHMHTCPSYW